MTKAQRFLLTSVGNLAGRREPLLQFLDRIGPAARGQLGDQLTRVIEVILDRTLAFAGDEYELLDPCCAGLLDRVVDQGLVNDRQHFLGQRLGRGQKPGSQSTYGKDGLAYPICHECEPAKPPGTRLCSATSIRTGQARRVVQPQEVRLGATEEQVLRLIDLRRKIRRAPLIGVHF